MNPKRIVIVGGGITGLAAANRLIELGSQQTIPLEVLVLEATQRLGGVISTVQAHDCLLEAGPDALFTEKPWATDLAKRIGLQEELIETNPNFRRSFIALNGQLHPVPEGFYLLAPSKILPFIFSPLLSWPGKWRALSEIARPSQRQSQDESLGSFVRRRFGVELLERVAQPMVGGIYSADPETLSLQATFPQFLELERNAGSVIRGLVRRRKSYSKRGEIQGPRYSLFVSFRSGMETFVRKLAGRIPKESFRFGADVNSIRHATQTERKNKSRGFALTGGGFEIAADALCLAVPAERASSLVKNLDEQLSLDLKKIESRSGMTVNLIYNRSDIERQINGFGFVVPAIEHKRIAGCTFSHVKFPGRAPEGKGILRAFIGGALTDPLWSESASVISSIVHNELKHILKIKSEPLFSLVFRHPRSLPQYKVGHLQLVQRIEERAQSIPNFTCAGNGYRGIGISDCVRSGESAAENLISQLRVNRAS